MGNLLGRSPEEIREIMERLKIKPKELGTSSIEYKIKDLLFEPSSPLSELTTPKDKEFFYFNKSLERLKKAGYERHIRPDEFFSLMVSYFSNKGKSPEEKSRVIEDMLTGHGEWLSAAVRRDEKRIILYLDPENVVWNGRTYSTKEEDVICSEKLEFEAELGKELTFNMLDLELRSLDLFEFLCPTLLDSLPNELLEVQFYIPASDMIMPLCFRNIANSFYIQIGDHAASRGVKVKK